MSQPVVAQSLVKRFGDFVAVDGIDFEIEPGETFAMLGPNGAGKTSTMRMVATISEPTSGELTILGLDARTDGPAIRNRLGVVPQEDHLDIELTVQENLMMYARYFGHSWSDARARAAELLEFAQLADRPTSLVEPLSGGMKRRLTIARALVNDPELVLLDEPTTGLDPQARQLLWDRLYELKERGISQLLTTHYMDEAEQLADRLVIMDGGKIVAHGSPSDLIRSSVTKEVVELRLDGVSSDDLPDGLRTERLRQRTLVYTDDSATTMAQIRASGIEPTNVLIRRSTLEDVFLKLTGHELVD
ncbi:MAG: ABC transporter ATP-binding protein [Acidimicrobiales bacterium]|nr:ABC transporter ATP-binding protein [Acidimicrobiales bacterium]RZV42399.1 MAG: ABC transporter ATP-binding protein [Acidimicrobiales bacterium]